jgi:hypothetical protein
MDHGGFKNFLQEKTYEQTHRATIIKRSSNSEGAKLKEKAECHMKFSLNNSG